MVRFTTTSEAKSDKNRRNRQNARYFPGILAKYPVLLPIWLNLAANQPLDSAHNSHPEKLMIPLSFVIYHTTLCSYHTTPQENQISGKYHSFTSKWPSLLFSSPHPGLFSPPPWYSRPDYRSVCWSRRWGDTHARRRYARPGGVGVGGRRAAAAVPPSPALISRDENEPRTRQMPENPGSNRRRHLEQNWARSGEKKL